MRPRFRFRHVLGPKKNHPPNTINPAPIRTYVQPYPIFLVFSAVLVYNKVVMRKDRLRKWGFDLGRTTMTTFYYKVWLPFTATKKRILILAIASYIALC